MTSQSSPQSSALTEDQAWSLLLALRVATGGAGFDGTPLSLGFDGAGRVQCRPAPGPIESLRINADGQWHDLGACEAAAKDLLDLYRVVALAGRRCPLAIGHLGQSLDGRIATESGQSRSLNGQANIRHLHRLRALSDAIVVGAGTVKADDPQLTTRMVTGASPMRVVIDSWGQLSADYRVFQDGAAPTLLIRGEGQARGNGQGDRHGQAEVVSVPWRGDELDVRAAVAALAEQGLHSLFVEGGGITVSRFLRQDALDRLQIAVAPLIIGSGRPGITLPPIKHIGQALRPNCQRFVMGDDVLFDCDLREGD